jgi:hypothetical protein
VEEQRATLERVLTAEVPAFDKLVRSLGLGAIGA